MKAVHGEGDIYDAQSLLDELAQTRAELAALRAKVERMEKALLKMRADLSEEGHGLVDDGERRSPCGSASLDWQCSKLGLPSGSCLCGLTAREKAIDAALSDTQEKEPKR